jgi:uncharacterized membrane protein
MDVLERRMSWALAAAALAALLVGAGIVSINRASANACGAACQKAYNQCRIATKGSPSCEAKYTSCMQRCRQK